MFKGSNTVQEAVHESYSRICKLTFIFILIYVCAGGVIFSRLEHPAELEKCDYFVEKLNYEYPKVAENLRYKMRIKNNNIQIADFFDLAHIFAEMKTHRSLLVREYKGHSILVTGTGDNLETIKKLENEERCDGCLHWLNTPMPELHRNFTKNPFESRSSRLKSKRFLRFCSFCRNVKAELDENSRQEQLFIPETKPVSESRPVGEIKLRLEAV